VGSSRWVLAQQGTRADPAPQPELRIGGATPSVTPHPPSSDLHSPTAAEAAEMAAVSWLICSVTSLN
jgi:hypothetical protein